MVAARRWVVKISRNGRPDTGAGGYVLRCAALQGQACTEFVTEGDCEHTRAVLVQETGGLVRVLDDLREELRVSQHEAAEAKTALAAAARANGAKLVFGLIADKVEEAVKAGKASS